MHIFNDNSNVDKALYAVTNHSAAGTKYGGEIYCIGASTINVALKLTASNATNNHGLIFDYGNVGFGTSDPLEGRLVVKSTGTGTIPLKYRTKFKYTAVVYS